MFDRRNFIKRGLIDAIGKQPDFWVILNADAYGKEGVLTQADLEEISALIDSRYLTNIAELEIENPQ